MPVRTLPLIVAALLSIVPSFAHAALRATLLAEGFNRPVAVVFDPAVAGAIYVVQQDGLVRTFLNGVPQPTPFLDLRGVVNTDGEQGLLGMAFPPDAATTGRVFVNFTNKEGAGNTVIARYTRSAANPMVVDVASRFDLQWPAASGGRQGFITQPYTNHNGGNLVFGPDGYLYIGMGDGGAGNDPDGNAQNPRTLLGKMLRVDVTGSPANGYTVPPTNPVFDPLFPRPDALPEIWAFGLRNPWRYTFDDLGPGATNAMILGDVGQGEREEIDYEPAGIGGRNYGWRVFEGSLQNPNVPPGGLAYQPVRGPTFEYNHAVGEAVTGGYVYRGTALGAAFQGRYFYADCVAGRIFSLALTVGSQGDALASDNVDHTAELGGPFQCIGAFMRDGAGELYFMDFDSAAPTTGSTSGRVFRIDVAGSTLPGTPTNLAADVQGSNVAVTWSAPVTGGTPSGYVMEAGTAPGLANIGAVPTSGTGLFFAGVPDGRYYVRVRATNTAGASAPTSDLILDVGCSGVPAAPTTLNTTVSGTLVGLNWNVAAGTVSTVLEVGYSPGATALAYSFAAPSAGVSVNAPPATYYVRVRAVNACGQSAPSVERTIVVPSS